MHPEAPDRPLLDAALELGRETTLAGVARRLAAAVAGLASARFLVLGVRDDERTAFRWHGVDLDDPGEDAFEHIRTSGGIQLFAAGSDGPRSRQFELNEEDTDELLGELWRLGCRRCAGSALSIDGRVSGTLLVGLRRGGPLDPASLRFLERLGRISAPFVWNCLTRERFARGDRRRDALIELSAVINTSLETKVVLDRARAAIGAIEGHVHSWIALLAEDGSEFQTFERPERFEAKPDELPSRRSTRGSVMERLVEEGHTYVSDDLADVRRFTGDEELAGHGVRRYVVAPLRARGRVLGAFLFGSKDPVPPLDVDVWLIENIAIQLALAIENARQYEEIQRLSARHAMQNVYLREEIQRTHGFAGMIGRSAPMREVFDKITRVAGTDSAVLITGATGVGKELVARAIHAASRVADQPMVKLNGSAIHEGVVESELFGHERGAFTSAVSRRIGLFELARDGTLFLDEVGDVPLSVQAKLLRVLQEGEFARVGGTETLKTNARILAATNRELGQAIEKGDFRADLFYRLNVFPIEVPPLDERKEDIPLLAEAFLEHFARAAGKRIEAVDDASMERLVRRTWPGNVRELKHVIERAVILCDGERLEIEEEPPPTDAAPAPDRLVPLTQMEEQHIRRALEHTNWVVEGPRGAAALLGLKGSTLRFRMKRLGIRRPLSVRDGPP